MDRVAESTGGRPAAVLAFDTSGGAILATDIGHMHAHVAVTDLGGRVLAELVDELDLSAGPRPVITWLTERCDRLLSEASLTRADLRAAALGVPGPVEFATGRVVQPMAMPGWDGFPLGEMLGEQLGCDVLVDNDANLMAVGEHAVGWGDVPDLVFLKVGTGIGAGIIADGRLYRGGHGAAGDIGHIQVPGYEDVMCPCGNRGCVGAVASGLGLSIRLVERGIPTSGIEDVVAQVRNGVPDAVSLVRDAGRALGTVLAGVVNLLNPMVIVIGGMLVEAGEYFLAGVREGVYGRSTALATRNLKIATSTVGGNAGIVGASTLAIDHLLAPDAVDRLLADGDRPLRVSA
jgi:predicted NBD/HSP70 family sugar kinase